MFETKIYIKLFGAAQPLEIFKVGDWIDLRANQDFSYNGFHVAENGVDIEFPVCKIPLGVAMKLPKGYEAIIAPRSSTYKNYGIIPWNCIGIIDNSYNGTNDQWMFGALCVRRGKVEQGNRICQFRIQLSQKATLWQKIKWLFSRGKIKFIYVDVLSATNRKGFGEGTKDKQ